jgi:hypothetical protein
MNVSACPRITTRLRSAQAQTVMLPKALLFATSKMLIYFQKRFVGIDRLTKIKLKQKEVRSKLFIRDRWFLSHRVTKYL